MSIGKVKSQNCKVSISLLDKLNDISCLIDDPWSAEAVSIYGLLKRDSMYLATKLKYIFPSKSRSEAIPNCSVTSSSYFHCCATFPILQLTLMESGPLDVDNVGDSTWTWC